MEKYFISYTHEGGFGNLIIDGFQKISDAKDISITEEYIERTRELKDVTILYFILIK